MIYSNELYHHGILGQKWGIRRYQNPDGSLTELGQRRLDRKDEKWAYKREAKITAKAYKKSRKELARYKKQLDRRYRDIGRNYINDYNSKMAELMNKHVGDLEAPSGKIVQFVAKRGEVGVYMALADRNTDMSAYKKGVWGNGRIAYKKDTVDMATGR